MEREWLEERLEKLAELSASSDGVTRLAYTEQDRLAREFIIKEMQEVGLTVRVDAVGNVIGRLEGTDREAAAVAAGSHLDSVPNGGKFDGVVGVLGALLAVKRLKAQGTFTHPLEVIAFASEESSRFGTATIGSKVMTGLLPRRSWSRIVDQEGISLLQVLQKQNFAIDQLPQAIRSSRELACFLELHIEQGAVLEENEEKIGVVEMIAAPTRLKITVDGQAAHSGAAPMDRRRDALVSAAKIILAVREIALEQSYCGTVGTVGCVEVNPGAINVVPGRVTLWVDIRGVNQESVIECIQEVKDFVSTLAEEEDTPAAIDVLVSERPVQLSTELARALEEICRTKKIPYRRMNSGAGHDAMNMAKITAAGMIFIPCKQGVSHNPEESVSWEDILTGVDVLAQCMHDQAQ